MPDITLYIEQSGPGEGPKAETVTGEDSLPKL